MLVRQLHLAFGRHHAKALDPADLAHADGRVDAWHVDAGFGDDHGDAFARIRRAADDLLGAFVRGHLAHTQPVRVGVFFRAQHLADGKLGQGRAAVFDTLDLKAEIGQRVANLVHRCGGVEVILEPAEREFHGCAPVLRSRPHMTKPRA